MKKLLSVLVIAALSMSAGLALAQVTNFRLYTSLTGNEVIADLANPTGSQFKTSTLQTYVTTTGVHNSLTTVGALPTCNAASKGYTITVSDANSPTYAGTLSGSGTAIADAICDGTNWTAH